VSWRACALTIALASAKTKAREWLLPCRTTSGNTGGAGEPPLSRVVRKRFIWSVLAELLLRFSRRNYAIMAMDSSSLPWVPGPWRLPVGHRHNPCHEVGPLPATPRPRRATWGARLSHRWTGCPIAALSGVLTAFGACVQEFGTLKITDRAHGIQETSSSGPLGNNPCY